jgi:hypothetical protein
MKAVRTPSRCWNVVAIVCLLFAFVAFFVSSGSGQPSRYCDATHCYERVCTPTDNCRTISNRVCRAVTKPECTTHSAKNCQMVPTSVCEPRAVYGCRSIYRTVCTTSYRMASTSYAAQQLGSYRLMKSFRPRMRHRVHKPYPSSNRPSVRPHSHQAKPYAPYQHSGQGQRPYQPRPQRPRPVQHCRPQVQKICGPVTKQECRYVSKEVCTYAPRETCYNREVQECRDEQKYVCEKGEDCRTIATLRDVGADRKPPVDAVRPAEPRIAKPDSYHPKPAPAILPSPLPDPPRPLPADNTLPPPRRGQEALPNRQRTTDESWTIRIDRTTVGIVGGGAATILGLLLLWPRRRSRSVGEMRRLGVEVRGEPDLGGQSVAHLADPPIGPRISVRTKAGTHRYKVKLD